MSRSRALLQMVILGAAWATLALGNSAAAVAAWPEMELGPSELQLGAGEQAKILVTIRNSGMTPVVVDKFVVSSLPGLTVTPPEAKALPPVASGSAVSTSLTVVAQEGFDGGKLAVQAHGRAQGRAGSPVSLIATATLDLSVPEPGSDLKVALLGVPDALDDGQSAHVVVQVTNPTGSTWSKVQLQARGSDNLCWQELDTDPCTYATTARILNLSDLQSKQSVDRVLILRAEDRVRLGTQGVSVVVSATRANRPSTHTSATAQADVKLTIFGIDLLSPFGIANLFLIPGVVAVLTFQLLRRLLQRPAPGAASINLKDPGMLLIVVPVGVLVYLGALLALRSNLRDKAGTVDALWLFGAGVVVGAVTAVVWWLRWWWVVGRKRFTTKDSPKKVLQRIRRRGAGFVQQKVLAGTRPLQLLAESEERRVACPQIYFEFREGQDKSVRGEFTRAVDGLDIEKVWAQVKREDVTLSWSDGQGVVELPSADVTPTDDTGPLLRGKP